MKSHLALAAAAAALIVAPAQARAREDPEAQLAKELAGRVAGEPLDCIQMHRIRSSRIIDETAIIYDAGSTIYVNRPTAGHDGLKDWDVMVSEPFNNRLCNTDTIRMFAIGSNMLTGIVFLGDFVPYRKERR